ncbi:MAG: hypothetical protein ABIH11_05675 [Candidatus Altiarchaeota archaeon]
MAGRKVLTGMGVILVVLLFIVLVLVEMGRIVPLSGLREEISIFKGNASQDNPIVGGSCGTVNPKNRDDCCVRENKDTPHDKCVGRWRYNVDTGKCQYYCRNPRKTVSNFQECLDEGYPVMESYPRQCRDSEGNTYVEVVEEPVKDDTIVGGQKDEHGCLGPAGYSWSEDVGACTRTWELNDNQRKAAGKAVEYVGFETGLTVIGVDVGKCRGCFLVHFSVDDSRVDVSLDDWIVTGKTLTPDECNASGGVVVKLADDGKCGENEVNAGRVAGFALPALCCTPKDIRAVKRYVSQDPEKCSTMDLGCDSGEEQFQDELGCGCWRKGGETEKNYCKKEDREMVGCIMLYKPVCGWLDTEKVECSGHPCAETYSNECVACTDKRVEFWTEGRCPEGELT